MTVRVKFEPTSNDRHRHQQQQYSWQEKYDAQGSSNSTMTNWTNSLNTIELIQEMKQIKIDIICPVIIGI